MKSIAIAALLSCTFVATQANAGSFNGEGAIYSEETMTHLVQRLKLDGWDDRSIYKVTECDTKYYYCDGGTPEPYEDGIKQRGQDEDRPRGLPQSRPEPQPEPETPECD